MDAAERHATKHREELEVAGEDNSFHIRMMAAECKNFLQKCLERFEATDSHLKVELRYTKDYLRRFEAWASYMGVFAGWTSSLDHRLRNHPSLIDMHIRILDIIRKNAFLASVSEVLNDIGSLGTTRDKTPDASYGYSIVATPLANFADKFLRIEDAIVRLNKLSIKLRSAVRMPTARRARRFAEQRTDLVQLSRFEDLAYRTVDHLYPSTSESLLRRLVDSMTDRYAQLKYEAVRSGYLEDTSVADVIEQGGKGREDTPDTVDNTGADAIDHERDSSGRPNVNIPASSVDTRRLQEVLTAGSSFAASAASKTMTINTTWRTQPPTPDFEVDETHTTCRFCFKLIDHSLVKSESGKIKWTAKGRHHYLNDLKPYICLSDTCQESHSEFASVSKWYRHMRSKHAEYMIQSINNHGNEPRRSGSFCPICSFTFTSDLVNESETDLTTTTRTTTRTEDMAKHIAAHLYTLMVISLRLESVLDQDGNEDHSTGVSDAPLSSGRMSAVRSDSFDSESETDSDFNTSLETLSQEVLSFDEHDQLAAMADSFSRELRAGGDGHEPPTTDVRDWSAIIEEIRRNKPTLDSTTHPSLDDSSNFKVAPPGEEPLHVAEKGYMTVFKRQVGNRVWMVPFSRNNSFTGRDSELECIRQLLFTRQRRQRTARVAITGLGGTGKTQIVLELLYRMRDEYQHCSFLWISASSEEGLSQAYLDAARDLGISGWDDKTADVKRLVQDHLSNEVAGQWILVFDNADDISMWVDRPYPYSRRLLDYLPKSSSGSIIFTTRDKALAFKLIGDPQSLVEVSSVSESDGKELLRKCLLNQNLLSNEVDTVTLLQRLTYLPLAISQAAMYINQNACDLQTYLSLLSEPEEEVTELLSYDFEDEGRYSVGENSVATTWSISFRQIQERNPLAADYLSFMACVNAKNIPQSLLPPGPSRKKETDAIGTLLCYSFITKQSADSAINMHELVHLTTRDWLRKEGALPHWTGRVTARLAEVLTDAGHENKVVWETYLPHAYYTLESGIGNEDDKDRLNLLERCGIYLYYDGRYNEAETLLKQVLRARKTKFGADHPSTLTSMANLASTYGNQGRWEEVEKLFIHVIKTSKTKLGPDHADTLSSMANLASTYGNQGRWEEAEKLFMQVIETRKTRLGAEHPDTLSSMANLASTYRNQGRREEAEKLLVQLMETSKTRLGAEHPDTLSSMANLASTYRNQGRREEAEKLFVQVMETSNTKLGADDLDSLTSMNNLALI